jgi:putative ABC transport system permease protein
LETLFRDVRFGARMLVKEPTLSLIAIITLALGIGANTAIFSVVNGVLLRPLPMRQPDRLVWIANTVPGDVGLSGVTSRVANFNDWRALSQSFEYLGAYFAFFDYGGDTLTGNGEPERLAGVGISQSFLSVLGVQPMLGRSFDDEECKWNGRKAAILSYRFWQSHFGSDAGIVGRSITLNDQPTVVVGVMGPSFDFASIFSPGSKADILTPFPTTQETDRWGNTLAVVGRLKPGVTIEKAQIELNLLDEQIMASKKNRYQFGAKLSSLPGQISGQFRTGFIVLFGAVGFVLLIACTNVSNLMLARAAARRKEIAIRSALGASRASLVRQMLTESTLLSMSGAAIGLPLAWVVTRAVATTQAISIPRLQSVGVDLTALAFTLFLALITGLLFGVVPAVQLSQSGLNDSLKDAGRGSSEGGHKSRIRAALVISEVALACVLLIGAGLLIRSFLRLLEVDPGFRPENAAAWRIDPSAQYETDAQRNAFFEELVKRVVALPGVESAGLTDALPLGRNRSWNVAAKGVTYPPNQQPIAFPRLVDSGYIRTIGIPLRDGRDFTPADTAKSQQVVIVNQTMARDVWPDKNAIGQVLLTSGGEFQVVGVVGNVRHGALDQEAGLEMYFPIPQMTPNTVDMVVRAKLPMESLVPSVRGILAGLDPELPTGDFRTLNQVVDKAVSPKRFITVLLGGFSVLALLLASLGIYGVISYSVTQRTNEIGIRLALGAGSRSVLSLIIFDGMKLALLGLAPGIVGAFALSRVMSSMLFQVRPSDPLSFSSIALLLFAVALLACYIPARRATKVDPVVALRYE